MIIYVSKDDYEIKKFDNRYPIYKGDIFIEDDDYKKRNFIVLKKPPEHKYPFYFSIGNKQVYKFFDVIDLLEEVFSRLNSYQEEIKKGGI